MPTIWDKDILIYCCSQLIEGVRQGREPKPSVQFQLFDFLASTNRSTGKNGYLLAEDALKRLYGVSIITNIETGGMITKEPFRLLEHWRWVEDASNITVRVTLPDWLYRSVLNLEVLTLHRDYFRLSGGIERRVYELCRKHCGNQDKWVVNLDTLHKKSGSRGPLKRFGQAIRALVERDYLPEYRLSYKERKITAYQRSRRGGLQELRDVLGIPKTG
jgi:plasmid replication initiation protein